MVLVAFEPGSLWLGCIVGLAVGMAFSAVVFGAMHLGKGLFRLGVRTLKARGQSVAASEEASIQLN